MSFGIRSLKLSIGVHESKKTAETADNTRAHRAIAENRQKAPRFGMAESDSIRANSRDTNKNCTFHDRNKRAERSCEAETHLLAPRTPLQLIKE